MANLGYILKQSVMDACNSMDDKQFRETINGLFNFAVNGELPCFKTPLQEAVFIMEKPAIEHNNSKWEKRRREFFNNDENLSF
jgi:hypothetical protein